MKVRSRSSGAQQSRDHVTKFSQHCRACVSCSWPTREIFAQNLATLCARCVQLEPGAAARRSGRVRRCCTVRGIACVKNVRCCTLGHAGQCTELHCTVCGTVRCGAERRCRAVCRAVCRPLQPAAAHCSCTPTPPLQ